MSVIALLRPTISHSNSLMNIFCFNFFNNKSYMPPGYPYNMENYGPVSMVSDDGKLPAPHPIIKEERLKESPSPNENPKSQLQVGVSRQPTFSQNSKFSHTTF